MPIYEYACRKCDHRFEKLLRSMTADRDEKIECPRCGSTQTARALSVFAVGAETARNTAPSAGTCGRCGGTPGSCASGF